MRTPTTRSRIISRLVQDAGLTAQDMAKAFGVSDRTWYQWVRDSEKMPIGTINTLAEILHLTDTQLLEVIKGKRKIDWWEESEWIRSR